jgi:WhiB family redox-sensing transcriptional regulator
MRADAFDAFRLHAGLITLHDLINPPEWHRDAACAEYPKETWFNGRLTASAKLICAGCLVRAECLSWALRQVETPVGVWGGATRQELLALRKSSAA